MILPPTPEALAKFFARCVMRGTVTDVRKLKATQCDDEIVDERRACLAEAQRRSRARRKPR